ncbi:hypothetical protein E2C01_042582 [Portunus trituberculatus]|uniref:Uncharacterized protein n=1 Tax=Portunus trituberculatus TaxID=210409 RepID=A0A5B7FU03_PORTR|nr:hypothetical protein [Portunus trituberculatus]
MLSCHCDPEQLGQPNQLEAMRIQSELGRGFPVLDWTRVKGSAPLPYEYFDAGHQLRGIRWVYYDALCWEVVVEGFRWGATKLCHLVWTSSTSRTSVHR